jgi:hypothetical protein
VETTGILEEPKKLESKTRLWWVFDSSFLEFGMAGQIKID